MTQRSPRRPSRTPLAYYLPHAGIALGLGLNVLAPLVNDAQLVGIGGNILTISLGVYLSRRSRQRRP